MKQLITIVLIALVTYITGMITSLPWWSFVIPVALIAVWRKQSPAQSFLAGFAGVFILWIVVATLKDMANEHILATKVAGILPLGGSYILLILITGIVGGLVGGLSALTGSYLRSTR